MRNSSGGQLTSAEVAGIRAATTPITPLNPAASQAEITAVALSTAQKAGIDNSTFAITPTNPVVSKTEIGTNSYTTVNQATATSFTLTGIASRTKFIGDARDVAGHAWVNYWATGRTPASLLAILATFSGAGSGYATLADVGDDLTVTASTTNPNFETAGVVTGDKVFLIGHTAISGGPVTAVSSNVLTLSGIASSGLGAAVALQPNVELSDSSKLIEVSETQDIYFKGLYFNALSVNIKGKATFENCGFFNCGITVRENASVTFVGYCNTFANYPDASAICVFRHGTMTGQVTVLGTTYTDPSEFKKAAIQAHSFGKVTSHNSRSLWTAFGVVAECGAEVIMENYVALLTYRDSVVNRGGDIYMPNLGGYKATAGYCVYNENGSIFCPNHTLVTGGGPTYNATGVYTTATDDEK